MQKLSFLSCKVGWDVLPTHYFLERTLAFGKERTCHFVS